MTIPIGVQLERDNALADAQNVINMYGEDITIYFRGEVQIERDKYNSIIRRDGGTGIEISLKAYPITFNPSRMELGKAGLKEDCDIMCKIATKDLTDNNLSYEDLDMIRATMIVRNRKYEIKDKQLDSQFADTYLYVHVGGKLI